MGLVSIYFTCMHSHLLTFSYNIILKPFSPFSYLDVSVELFGSSASGFALASSDVNLNITIAGAKRNKVSVKTHTNTTKYFTVSFSIHFLLLIPVLFFSLCLSLTWVYICVFLGHNDMVEIGRCSGWSGKTERTLRGAECESMVMFLWECPAYKENMDAFLVMS